MEGPSFRRANRGRQMRLSEIAAGAAVVCLLLALLTWLLLRGISTDSADYSATLRLFDEFALAEASLHRDVLQARAGLLRDYDPLNASIAEIDSVVAQLRSKISQDGVDVTPVDRLAALTKLEEESTERFKSDNALLRNSLSYLGLLSTNPDFVERNPLLAPSIGALAAAILQAHSRFFAPVQPGCPESPCRARRPDAGRGVRRANRSGVYSARSPPRKSPSVSRRHPEGAVRRADPTAARRDARAVLQSSHGSGGVGATISSAPLRNVALACGCAHRSREAAAGPSDRLAKARSLRAFDRGELNPPDQLSARGDRVEARASARRARKGDGRRPRLRLARRDTRPGLRLVRRRLAVPIRMARGGADFA